MLHSELQNYTYFFEKLWHLLMSPYAMCILALMRHSVTRNGLLRANHSINLVFQWNSCLALQDKSNCSCVKLVRNACRVNKKQTIDLSCSPTLTSFIHWLHPHIFERKNLFCTSILRASLRRSCGLTPGQATITKLLHHFSLASTPFDNLFSKRAFLLWAVALPSSFESRCDLMILLASL